MDRYQIEATVEKFEEDEKGNLIIQLKGCGKYCFEKIKDKEYWNIFENLYNTEKSVLNKQDDTIQTGGSNGIISQHLLDHAFIENKKLKFKLKFDSEIKKYIVIGISHASN